MSYGPIDRRFVALEGGSATSSTRTSNPILVASYRQITASIQTAGPGNHILQATNYDGLSNPLAEGNWSAISSTITALFVNVEPGMRWLRWIKPATDSLATCIFNCRT